MDAVKGLEWVLSGGGAGWLVYYLIENYMPRLAELPSQTRRLVSFAMAGSFGIVAWVGIMWLAGQPWPSEPRAWVSAVFLAAATAIVTATGIHTKQLKATPTLR